MKTSQDGPHYTPNTSDSCIVESLKLDESASICGGAAPPAKPPTELLPPPMTEPRTWYDDLKDAMDLAQKAVDQLNKENDMKK